MRPSPPSRSPVGIVRPLAAALPLLLLLAGCASSGDSAGDGGVGEVAAGELDGEALYQANCAQCHGADLRGSRVGPPLLDPIYLPDRTADAAFLLSVRNGVQPDNADFGPMPALPGVSDAQVEAITAYVRDQQRAAGLLE